MKDDECPFLPRSGHAAAPLPTEHTHDVIIFGGYKEDPSLKREATNEAWLFSEKAGKWTPVKYAGNEQPRVRLVSQAAVVENYLYIIGGWDPGHKQDGGSILDDVWKLDLNTYHWSELTLKGEKLMPLSRHQAVAVGSQIFIHTHRNAEDLLVLEGDSVSKMAIAGPSGSPALRGLHSMTAVDGNLYIYAGAPKEGGMLGDIWEVDLANQTWKELDPDGQVPHVRCSHAAAATGKNIICFGGSYYKDTGGLQPLNDLFMYDPRAGLWKWPAKEVSSPRPRNAHSLTPLQNGRLLMHGGWDPFKLSYNDTFLLDPSAIQWEDHSPDVDW